MQHTGRFKATFDKWIFSISFYRELINSKTLCKIKPAILKYRSNKKSQNNKHPVYTSNIEKKFDWTATKFVKKTDGLFLKNIYSISNCENLPEKLV